MGGALALSLVRAVCIYLSAIRSSKTLHERMLRSVLRAPVLLFDTNIVRRILNRFSKDIDVMENMLPDALQDSMQAVWYVIGSIVLPIILNPLIAAGAVPLSVAVIFVARLYLRSSRELARLEAVNKSSVLSHFTDSIEGMTTIKAHGMEMARFRDLCR